MGAAANSRRRRHQMNETRGERPEAARIRSTQPGVERDPELKAGRRQRGGPAAGQADIAETLHLNGSRFEHPDVDPFQAGLLFGIGRRRLLRRDRPCGAVTFAPGSLVGLQTACGVGFAVAARLREATAGRRRVSSGEDVDDAMRRAAAVARGKKKRLQRDDPDQARAKSRMRCDHRNAILSGVDSLSPEATSATTGLQGMPQRETARSTHGRFDLQSSCHKSASERRGPDGLKTSENIEDPQAPAGVPVWRA